LFYRSQTTACANVRFLGSKRKEGRNHESSHTSKLVQILKVNLLNHYNEEKLVDGLTMEKVQLWMAFSENILYGGQTVKRFFQIVFTNFLCTPSYPFEHSNPNITIIFKKIIGPNVEIIV